MLKSEIWMIPNKKGTELETKIFYVCDGFACSKLQCGKCRLTGNPSHAKKFELTENDISRRLLEIDSIE